MVVLNRGRPGTRELGEAPEVVAQYGLPVCPVFIMDRLTFRTSEIPFGCNLCSMKSTP